MAPVTARSRMRCLALATLFASAAAQSSCRYANDGECDDPSGTGLCRLGTDDADCCPAHSHSISTTHCECNTGYHLNSAQTSCVVSSSSSSRRRSSSYSSSSYSSSSYSGSSSSYSSYTPPPPPPQSYEQQEETKLAALGAVGFVLIGIAMCFPCIVYGCAHSLCIDKRLKERQERPTSCAWTVCILLFVVAFCSTFLGLLGILWFILPFFMIIPFCCDSCYDAPIAAPTTVIVHQAQNPVAAAQPVINITNSQPQSPIVNTQAQPYGMQQQPPMMQQQPMPVMAQAQPAAMPVMAQAMAVNTAPKGGGASPSMAAAGPQSLSQFLLGLNLAQYDAQLREMGAVDVSDLVDVSEAEFEEMGMKKLEIKRLIRTLAAAGGGTVTAL